ncbi:Ciliate-c4 protein kinase, partial [Globisporangium splendens]
MKVWYETAMQQQPAQALDDELPFTGFTRLRRIGKDGFGEVWDVKEDTSGICYALKHIATEIRVGNLLFPELELDVDTTALNLVTPMTDEVGSKMLGSVHSEQRTGCSLSKENTPFTRLFRVAQVKRDFWLLYERGGRALRELVFVIQGEFHVNSRVYRLEHRSLYQQMRADSRIVQSLMRRYIFMECLVKKLLEAVQILSGHRIVHADIKPDNILLRPWPAAAVNNTTGSRSEKALLHVQLIDFGSAFVSGLRPHPANQGQGAGGGGTPEYIPPETLVPSAPPPPSQTSSSRSVVLGTSTVDSSSSSSFDVWSVGAVFLELLCGFPLWLGYRSRIEVDGKEYWVKSGGLFTTKHRDPASIQERQREVVANLERPIRKYPGMLHDWPPQVAASALDLLNQLLDPSPQTRVPSQEALNHPFCSWHNK